MYFYDIYRTERHEEHISFSTIIRPTTRTSNEKVEHTTCLNIFILIVFICKWKQKKRNFQTELDVYPPLNFHFVFEAIARVYVVVCVFMYANKHIYGLVYRNSGVEWKMS